MNPEEAMKPVPKLNWFKSSYSTGSGGECVEVATSPEAVHVRDSKDTHGPALTVSPETWSRFIASA